MDDTRKAELRALADAATRGPWANGYDDESGRVDERNGADITCPAQEDGRSWIVNGGHDDWGVKTGVVDDCDAAFIAAARTAVPELLDALDAAEADLATQEGITLARCRERDEARAQVAGLRTALQALLNDWDVRKSIDPAITRRRGQAARQAREVLAATAPPVEEA